MGKQRILPTLVVVMLVISFFTSVFFVGPITVRIARANPGDVSESWYNATTLNVTVLEIAPRINWYDFQYNQSGTWVSRRNAQIDVNASAEYRFIVNISSDQGWADVEYINITAWYDQGNDASTYNGTLGGNLNLMLQYENTTGNANWSLLWPTGVEVVEGDYSDAEEWDPFGAVGYTECHNLSFSFVPGYQFRYAPGDGGWSNATNATDDAESWNFNISADDGGNVSWVHDEFGVYSYTEIISAGWPTIIGNPGQNATASSNITLVTRSNGNYSLSVNVGNLTHKVHPTANISRDKIWLRGGDLAFSANFTAITGVVYLFGSLVTAALARANGTSLATTDVEYKCNIPLGQMAGDYNATIKYHLSTS